MMRCCDVCGDGFRIGVLEAALRDRERRLGALAGAVTRLGVHDEDAETTSVDAAPLTVLLRVASEALQDYFRSEGWIPPKEVRP